MSRAFDIIQLMEQELPAAQQQQQDKMQSVIANKRAPKPKSPPAVVNPNMRKPGQLTQNKMKTDADRASKEPKHEPKQESKIPPQYLSRRKRRKITNPWANHND